MCRVASKEDSMVSSRQGLSDALPNRIDGMPIHSIKLYIEWLACFDGFLNRNLLSKHTWRVHCFSFGGIGVTDSCRPMVERSPEHISVCWRLKRNIGTGNVRGDIRGEN